MHHEPRRLVHYQKIFVLEYLLDGYILGRKPLLDKTGLDAFSIACLAGRRRSATVRLHETFFDHTPRRASAHAKMPGDQLVQALSSLFGRNLEAFYVGARDTVVVF